MFINAYDTTAGKYLKIHEKVDETIKILHLTKDLTPTRKEGVYSVNFGANYDVPIFTFPITTEGYDRKKITVFDERPFRSKSSNQIVQPNDLAIMRLAAMIQHDAATGDFTPLKNARLQSTKAFAEALSIKLAGEGTLDATQIMTLKITLAYYFVCLIENDPDEIELVAMNVISSIYGSNKGMILGVIEGLGLLKDLKDLLGAITKNPTLYKLKHLDFGAFLNLVGGMTSSLITPRIIMAAAEAPCLFTAFVYGATMFKIYANAPLGRALDPKYNKDTLEKFKQNIHYTYDLKE